MPTTTSTRADMLAAAQEAEDALDQFVAAVAHYKTACAARVDEFAALDGARGLHSDSGTCRNIFLYNPQVFITDAMAYLFYKLRLQKLQMPVGNLQGLADVVDLSESMRKRIPSD